MIYAGLIKPKMEKRISHEEMKNHFVKQKRSAQDVDFMSRRRKLQNTSTVQKDS